MSIEMKEFGVHPKRVQANQPPRLIHADSFDDSQSICFLVVEEFKDLTDWPEKKQEIYDIYQKEFTQLHTFAHYPKTAYNPFYIVKPTSLAREDCPGLFSYIEKLKLKAVALPAYIPTWMRRLTESEPETSQRLTPLLAQEPTSSLKRKQFETLEEKINTVIEQVRAREVNEKLRRKGRDAVRRRSEPF